MPEPTGGPPGQEPDPAGRTGSPQVERVLASSLLLVYIPVVILLLAGLGAFVYGGYVFVDSARRIVEHPIPVGHHIGSFLLDVDLLLIGATLLISALGLYELFIGEIHLGPSTRLPGWLEMHDLNDLKARVIAMIVLVVSVSFVEVVVDEPSGRHVLDLGAGIALVIVALTVFLRLGGHGGENR
jgi:uncharacterized membrane protein YqhA